MINIHAADTTVHMDEILDHAQRDPMEEGYRTLDGVVSLHMANGPAAHLVVVSFDPDIANNQNLLTAVAGQSNPGELIGFHIPG